MAKTKILREDYLSNTSYSNIYASFETLFPEFKQSVKEWTKSEFNKETRLVHILLENGCSIEFGTMKDEKNGYSEWVWVGMLDMSKRIKEKLNITVEENI